MLPAPNCCRRPSLRPPEGRVYDYTAGGRWVMKCCNCGSFWLWQEDSRASFEEEEWVRDSYTPLTPQEAQQVLSL